ncbi:DUF3050 domain-containing protein [Aquirufa ecclesiirivi]|uniref:DUF3050 domain-containing protein n=1 Tax=Aquirufa ecclesiirivi TaxID=2715124 RepID=UPI0022A8CEA9|nr:DUF3050 domain-containing protein [Aquirufa ecclesiirivi]MCZ2473164.1 DUF3050 domain-containing protein [Aquirufa ecclesiirivi]
MENQLLRLTSELEGERNKLLSHPIYAKINDLAGLQKFTQIHVFAVWDFMSLLKSLQIGLTSVQLPWIPVGSADTRYLINEIVLGEESDVDEQGNRISHFELYQKAMIQMGASTEAIDLLIKKVREGINIQDAIREIGLHPYIQSFLEYTFDIALHAPIHVKAGVFTFGREDLIPSMFHQLLERLYTEVPEQVSTFRYYIERHIEVDGDHHSHLAKDMVSQLCGKDENKWEEVLQASKKALEMRYLLWDAYFYLNH